MTRQRQWSWREHIRVAIYDHETGLWRVDWIHNQVTDVGLNLIRDAFANGSSIEIKYVELGDDNTAPTAGDTSLGNSFFRKQVTQQTSTGTGSMQTDLYVAPFEANQQIEEIGWFAGPDADGTTDSGIMIARTLYSKLKTDSESLSVERTDSITAP